MQERRLLHVIDIHQRNIADKLFCFVFYYSVAACTKIKAADYNKTIAAALFRIFKYNT